MISRFSKATVLRALDEQAAAIAQREGFNRGNGTSQLRPHERAADEDIRRAVEYGRMRALERFAELVADGQLGGEMK